MNWYNLNETTDRDLRKAVVIRTLYDRGRQPAIDAVCDAIEGFCEEVCIMKMCFYQGSVGGRSYYLKPQCSSDFNKSEHDRYQKVCPYCNRRVVEQFDILKEEGV